MDPRTYYLIDNALRKGNFEELKKHISTAEDLHAVGKTMKQYEMTVSQMIQRDQAFFLPALLVLLEMGFSPADPEVDRTGLFRIANILYYVPHNDLTEAEICQLLDRVLALSPEADMRNLAGIHPLRMVLGSWKWGSELMDWVIGHTPNLKEIDAEMPLLYAMGYDNSMNLFLHSKMLMEAGANANWELKGEDFDSNALFWLLQSQPIPIPLLYLFIANGASSANFLLELIAIKKKKFLPHIAPVASSFLALEKNLALLDMVDGYGFSPLHYAVLKEDIPLVANLVAAGANIHLAVTRSRTLYKVKVSKGATPLSMVEDMGNENLREALLGRYVFTDTSTADIESALAKPGQCQVQFKAFLKFMDSQPGIEWRSKPIFRGEGVDPITCKIMDQSWAKRTDSHLELLKIGWFFGRMECGWSVPGGVGGGFRIADWSEMISQNILCFHEDYGRTYFKITSKGIQLRFQATYEEYRFFSLQLSLDEFMQRLFQVGGMPYWTYFFFKNREPFLEKIPFFKDGMEKLKPEGDVGVFGY